MNDNGFSLTLVIRYVDSSRNVVGWVQDSTQTNIFKQGSWDEANAHLHFIRALKNYLLMGVTTQADLMSVERGVCDDSHTDESRFAVRTGLGKLR